MFIYILQGHGGFQGAVLSELPRHEFSPRAGATVVDCIPVQEEARAYLGVQCEATRLLEQVALAAWQYGHCHALEARGRTHA